ncbi:prohead core protein [Escherichia phage vB_EcoM-UFV05]|uniref:Prohead core protein n=1 Tax=Escherichia phage KIT03 TaxID=2218499 RepID=A0A3G9H935_9CAUD|nr:prohead [Escherichia phage KIT03]EIP2092536.1 prohead core protein [Shigella flexneri]QWT76873.1 prohead core protein [Escherichia phage vB_EcoM-UFV09]UYE93139.1 prohead core protein [Escherichia phage vB_EcoM-UFV05]UYL84032.1 prohead core protein [Escherichia phage vB_EcoM-UFV06]UYL84318.1 prohead core protein [Escherichia phage vB_EcoM-UFV10]UYL84604.1 prohead core protein [Escherichia phage vB_EcoM-UFV11]WPJ71876.1 prohead core protein [Escherichia phage vB-Eco-KMB42]
MEGLIEAIKSNDLVAARKLFAEAMAARTTDLIKEEKITIARNFLIEGEEPEDEDEDEDDDEDSDDKDDKKDKDSDEDEDDE